jgi:hypothetical protein
VIGIELRLYLNQFLLALLITIYLGLRYFAPGNQPRRRQKSLLEACFWGFA